VDNDFNAQFDAMALPLLRGAGLVSDAVFNSVTPCTVLIDRNVQYQSLESGIVSQFTRLTAFRAEIGQSNPAIKSAFVVGALEYVVDKIVDGTDESRIVMLVTPRPALPIVPFNLTTEDGEQLVTEDSDYLVTES
jgi:hypothetical protein